MHKENGGVSSARNVGLDYASGEYVIFCDPDDRLLPNALEIFNEAIENTRQQIGLGETTLFQHLMD